MDKGGSFSSSRYCPFFVSVGGHGMFISGWFLICTWEVHFGIDDLSCEGEKKWII